MISKEAKKPIIKYLKSVKRNIREKSREEQQELIRSLEEHIYGALDAKFSINPTIGEVQSVIDEMETPESFQPITSKKVPTHAERQLGKWALILVFSGVVLPIIFLIIAELSGSSGGFGKTSILLLGIFFVIAGLAMGIAGRKSPAGKAAIITSAILIGALSLLLPFNVVTGSSTGSSNDSTTIPVEYSESVHQED